MVIERRKYSPPQVARMFGVSTTKIIGWIQSGQLTAINVADGPKNRPRYLIDRDAIAQFEKQRAVVPNPVTTQKLRRRAASGVKEYF